MAASQNRLASVPRPGENEASPFSLLEERVRTIIVVWHVELKRLLDGVYGNVRQPLPGTENRVEIPPTFLTTTSYASASFALLAARRVSFVGLRMVAGDGAAYVCQESFGRAA